MPKNDNSRWLTVKALGDYLGVSASYIYKCVERGQIPHTRIGKLIRFDQEQIDRWVQTQSHKNNIN